MNNPEKRIVEFIQEHHVLTLATSSEKGAYCSNCFYAYMENENLLVFTSDMETRHAQEALKNNYVAASIVLETNVVGKIQGIQLNGNMIRPEGELLKKAKKRYLKRFPVAQLMKTTIWILEPYFIKMTDNRLGFGKKLIWEKEID